MEVFYYKQNKFFQNILGSQSLNEFRLYWILGSTNRRVQAIKENILVNQDFYSSNTKVNDILKGTAALNNKKNCTFGNILTKLLKEVSDICAPALNDIWNNEIITQKSFPNNLKLADVTSVFKKGFCRWYLKSMTELCRSRFQSI